MHSPAPKRYPEIWLQVQTVRGAERNSDTPARQADLHCGTAISISTAKHYNGKSIYHGGEHLASTDSPAVRCCACCYHAVGSNELIGKQGHPVARSRRGKAR